MVAHSAYGARAHPRCRNPCGGEIAGERTRAPRPVWTWGVTTKPPKYREPRRRRLPGTCTGQPSTSTHTGAIGAPCAVVKLSLLRSPRPGLHPGMEFGSMRGERTRHPVSSEPYPPSMPCIRRLDPLFGQTRCRVRCQRLFHFAAGKPMTSVAPGVAPPPSLTSGAECRCGSRERRLRARIDVFDGLDVPLIERDPTDLVATRRHVKLPLELLTVGQHDQHDSTVLRKPSSATVLHHRQRSSESAASSNRSRSNASSRSHQPNMTPRKRTHMPGRYPHPTPSNWE